MDPEYARKKALMDWIVDGMAGRHYQKPTGFRADREPDASWHRPSYHRPGVYGKETEEISEEERIEKCAMQKNLYAELVQGLKADPSRIDEANETIRATNQYFKAYGCPAMPEFEPPTPVFAKKR